MRPGLTVRLAVVIAAFVFPLAVAGCGGGAAQPAAAQTKPEPVAAGWELSTLVGEGVALSLPPGWKAFDLDKDVLQKTMQELRQANPGIAEMLSGQTIAMASHGVKFFAMDMNAPSLNAGFATNLHIIHQTSTALGDLDTAMSEAIAEAEQQLGDALDGPVLRGKITSGSGHTLGRLNYDFYMNGPGGGTLPLSVSQYITSAGGDVYIITCTTLMDYRADYASTFEAIAGGPYFLK